MRQYPISIITPFHNVELHRFRLTVESMRKQTLGFENIQWIIVLHNCDPEHITGVKQLTEGFENVLIAELNNDCHTASSPRNYGLRIAEAPYVGFLDGDDSYTPECLEKALKEITDADAQIAFFRMEYELENEFAVPLPDTSLWNQCEERILIEKGNWNSECMFSGMFGWVTSRLFQKQFLIDNNLYFDESLILFEDFHMLLHVVSKAERIVYLPQLVGYHYLINGDSTIQSKKSGQTLVEYAAGLKILYDTFENLEIQTDFIERSTLILSHMILDSDSITEDQRITIKELLGSYVEKSKPFPVKKLLSPEMVEEMYRIPRAVILNTEDPLNSVQVQNTIDGIFKIGAILRRNQDTDFGKKYGFQDFSGIEDYQKQVPLMNDAQLETYVRLQTGIGESNILTSEKTTRYLIKKPHKIIPSTDSQFSTFVQAFAATLSGKRSLLLASRDSSLFRTNDGAIVAGMESLLLMDYFTKVFYAQKDTGFPSSVGVYFDELYTTKEDFYHKLIFDALLFDDLEQIVALTTDHVIFALELLIRNQEDFLDEIYTVKPKRSAELKIIFSQGWNGILPKIWPKLERVIAFGAGEYYESFRQMQQYLGGIPHNHGYYFTEEALLGKAVSDNSNLFEYALQNNDFFEFLSLKRNTIDLLSKAEIGEPYQIIVTNHSGLYRYLTDHFIVMRKAETKRFWYTIY